MWQANFLIIVYITLDSFCLEIVPKANITSEMSNAARHFGRLVIGSDSKLILKKNKKHNGANQQAGLEDPEQPPSTAWHELVESKLSQLNPTVYCGGDAMTLHVQGSTMPNFMIDGGDGTVPLTWIPANCGLSVTEGPADAVFTVPYQGCHVTQQGDGHVLLLHLWGMPMKMFCPLAMYIHPNVSCLPSGLVTKISCNPANVKLKVNDKWEDLIPASSTCGFTTESETDGMVVTAPYQSSCWQMKGDERFLSILYGNEEFILPCPDSNMGISYQSHEPNVHTPTDTISTPNISTATTGLASNPGQPLSYPFDYLYYDNAWEIPEGISTTPLVTTSPPTNAPAAVSTSKSVDIMYPFPQMYYPFGHMLYHHKPKPYGYPWAFPPKAPTTAPTTTATTVSTVVRNPQESAYPFDQNYPFGPMLHHHKPKPYGYPWAFPPKAPTTAPTTTATTVSTVVRNPQEPAYPFDQNYPFGPMLHHHKPKPYAYPWAFPPKAPTTAPTTTATTVSTVVRNPQEPAYPFDQNYPFGPMLHHHKPKPYGYPCAFPPKAPTTAPTTTTATTDSTVVRNPQQPAYPFDQNYPFGPMLHHHKPKPYGYPWAFPPKAPTTTPTTTTSQTTATTVSTVVRNPQQSAYPFDQNYPFGPMLHHHKHKPYGCLWAFPPKAPTTAPTTPTTEMAKTSTTTATTLTSVANDPHQLGYPFNQRYYLFGPMHCHHRPSHNLGYPLFFPAKVFTTASNNPAPTTQTTTAITTKSSTPPNTVASNPQQPPHPFNQKYHPIGTIQYHPKPMPHVYSPKAPASASITETAQLSQHSPS